MTISRRTLLQSMGAVGAATLLKPSFTFAQSNGTAGPIKNFIHIFLNGGACGRYLFPYLDGELDQFLRSVRPNLSVAANSILSLSGTNQNGRANSVGFHPEFRDLTTICETTGCGASIITEYGVTEDNAFSHEIAQGQFQVGSNRAPNTFEQGWLPRLIDTCKMPAMSVWSLLDTSPLMFNAATERPVVLSSLNSLNFLNRNEGSFNCRDCDPASGDKISSAVDDSAFQRSIAEKLAQQPHPEIPFDEAFTKVASSVYPTVKTAQIANALTVDAALFRPYDGDTAYSSFQNAMIDIAKLIIHTNSTNVPSSLHDSAKVFCTMFGGWDAHASLAGDYPRRIKGLSGALKGLITTLSQLNLLDSTLILIHSEFGRTTRQNVTYGLDHAYSNHACVIGGKVARSVLGPDASLEEANSKNYFSAQVAFTGVLKTILRSCGFSNDNLNQVFKDSLPGESDLALLR